MKTQKGLCQQPSFTQTLNTFKVMNNKMNLWMAAVAVVAIFFASCSKDQSSNINSTPSSELSIPEIEVLASQADEAFMNTEVQGGTESEAFIMESDGLPDAYQVTESTADEINSTKRDGNASRLKVCLSKLELDPDQIAKIRRLFRAYEDCKHSIIVRHGNALRELIKTYNGKREELVKALRNGRISKAEFEEKMKALRIEFNRHKNDLASKARAALKDCYTKMLRGLNGVMTERQWKAFVNCYRI